MTETVAQVASRIGIPPEALEDLIELPLVSEALVLARDNPNMRAESVWATLDLPVIDPDGLDIPKLERELAALRNLATKGDGSRVSLDARALHPMLKGRLKLAEGQAERRLDIILRVHELMTNHYAEPQSMDMVKELLTNEINFSGAPRP